MANPNSAKLVNCALLASFFAAIALPGCATEFDLRKAIPWETGKDGKFESPMQVATFWTDAVQNSANKDKGTRGFGGRLYFYGRDPNKPVKVKGTLVVYAFDESNRDPNNVVPDRKYIFPPEQFQMKYDKTNLGNSYSIWLPWDDVGGEQKQISLIVRFTSDKGEMVSSDESKEVLPGMPSKKEASIAELKSTVKPIENLPPMQQIPFGANSTNSYAVQQASFQQPDSTAGTPAASNSSGVIQTSATAVQQGTVQQGTVQPGLSSVMMTPQNQSADSYGTDPGARRMSTTTIAMPQSPRMRFAPTNSAPNPAGNAPQMPLQVPGTAFGPTNGFAPNNSVIQNQQTPITMTPAISYGQNQNLMAQYQGASPFNQNRGGFGAASFGPGPAGAMAQSAPVNPQSQTNSNSQPVQPSPAQMTSMGSAFPVNQSPAGRSGPERPRVLGAPIERLEFGRDPWQPSRTEQPSSPPFALSPVQGQ